MSLLTFYVGNKIQFAEDRNAYEIVARNAQYLICIKGTLATKRIFYTVIKVPILRLYLMNCKRTIT